jgi:polyhydroxybutyrate depolymerase
LFVVPPIETWAASWAARNGCDLDVDAVPVDDGIIERRYANCDAPVVLYTVRGGGHTWPGGSMGIPPVIVGMTTDAIDATETMWQFFTEVSE